MADPIAEACPDRFDDVTRRPVRPGAAGRRPYPPRLGGVAEGAQRSSCPRRGPGSVAPAGPRIGAFLLDVVLSALIAGLFTAPELPRNRSLLVFAVLYFASPCWCSRRRGCGCCELRVVRVDRPEPIGLWRSVVRTVGVILLVPALLRDAGGRSLHDRLTQTAVVRS